MLLPAEIQAIPGLQFRNHGIRDVRFGAAPHHVSSNTQWLFKRFTTRVALPLSRYTVSHFSPYVFAVSHENRATTLKVSHKKALSHPLGGGVAPQLCTVQIIKLCRGTGGVAATVSRVALHCATSAPTAVKKECPETWVCNSFCRLEGPTRKPRHASVFSAHSDTQVPHSTVY